MAVRPAIHAFNIVGDTSSLFAISDFDMRWRRRSISMFKNICSLRLLFGASADSCIITHMVCLVKKFSWLFANNCELMFVIASARKNFNLTIKNIAKRVVVYYTLSMKVRCRAFPAGKAEEV